MIKDDYEVEVIRQNLMLTEIGYHYILRTIREGMTENEIAADLEYFLKKKGAKKPSFDTIVASGWRAALPHGVASDKKVEKGEIILLDYGIFKDGYCSDFTRCYSFDKIYVPKFEEIRKIVFEALKAAEAAVRPGAIASQVHKAAYDVIDRAGYANFFNHSPGHGVGIDIHEFPRISAAADTVLREGMVFTVEPGIYLPGEGGVRLEDMVLVTKDGVEVLTETDYEF
jgi:Xaa-Pro aminopeptidase